MNVLIIALDRFTPVPVANADVLVVAPALNSRLHRWLSDEDGARRRRRHASPPGSTGCEQTGGARAGTGRRRRSAAGDRRCPADVRGRRDRDRRPVGPLDAARRRARLAGASPLRAPGRPCRAGASSPRLHGPDVPRGNRRPGRGVSSTRQLNYSERNIMINLTHTDGCSLATVSAVVVGAAGIVAGQGQAAPPGSQRPAACSQAREVRAPAS